MVSRRLGMLKNSEVIQIVGLIEKFVVKMIFCVIIFSAKHQVLSIDSVKSVSSMQDIQCFSPHSHL